MNTNSARAAIIIRAAGALLRIWAHDCEGGFAIARWKGRWQNGPVSTQLMPANSKARSLLRKLESLAERGIGGEKRSAQQKIARLKARFDFSLPETTATPDLFSGTFQPSRTARKIHSFEPHEFDVANSVKWAIEATSKIHCVYRDGTLLAEATPATAKRLGAISEQIAGSFRALVGTFNGLDGVSAGDRNVFIMGLYDGMMNETRKVGQRLPGRVPVKKGRKPKQGAAGRVSGLHLHPYTVGVSLGKQIRFSAPLEQITAELEAAARKHITQS